MCYHVVSHLYIVFPRSTNIRKNESCLLTRSLCDVIFVCSLLQTEVGVFETRLREITKYTRLLSFCPTLYIIQMNLYFHLVHTSSFPFPVLNLYVSEQRYLSFFRAHLCVYMCLSSIPQVCLFHSDTIFILFRYPRSSFHLFPRRHFDSPRASSRHPVFLHSQCHRYTEMK